MAVFPGPGFISGKEYMLRRCLVLRTHRCSTQNNRVIVHWDLQLGVAVSAVKV